MENKAFLSFDGLDHYDQKIKDYIEENKTDVSDLATKTELQEAIDGIGSGGSGGSITAITQAEYNALSDDEKNSDTLYIVEG